MRNIMKKAFSLLLVGAVTVSMFSFITPNRVNAVADLDRIKAGPIPFYITVNIGPYTRQYRNTTCEVAFFDEDGECTNIHFLSDPERHMTMETVTLNLRRDTRRIVVKMVWKDGRRTLESGITADITYVFSIYRRIPKSEILNIHTIDECRLSFRSKKEFCTVTPYVTENY